MNEQEKWKIVDRIQSSYYKEAYSYIKNTSKEQIEQDLNSIDSSYTILRLLSSFVYNDIKDVVDTFFEKIIYFSLDGNPTQIIWARKTICSIDRDFLDKNLEEVILKIINSEKESNYLDYLYRNIAILLSILQYKDFLSRFLEKYCMSSNNLDIKEICDDYGFV